MIRLSGIATIVFLTLVVVARTENAVPEWNRQSIYTGSGVGHSAVATFETATNEFITFLSSNPFLGPMTPGSFIRIVRHSATGNFLSDIILSLPGVTCTPGCSALFGVTSPNAGEIVALVRISPPEETRLVVFRQSDGAYLREVPLETPANRKYAGITRNADGTLLVFAVESVESNVIWFQKRSSDGQTVLYERRYRKGPYAQFKYRLSQPGSFSYSRTASTNILFNVAEDSPLNQNESQYPFNVEINVATGDVVRTTSYRGLARFRDYFQLTAAYRSTAGDVFLGGHSYGQSVGVGDNRGYWLWKLRDDDSVEWFSGFMLPETPGQVAGFPVALKAIGDSLLVLKRNAFSLVHILSF